MKELSTSLSRVLAPVYRRLRLVGLLAFTWPVAVHAANSVLDFESALTGGWSLSSPMILNTGVTGYGSATLGASSPTSAGYLDANFNAASAVGTNMGGIKAPTGFTFRAVSFDIWPSANKGGDVIPYGTNGLGTGTNNTAETGHNFIVKGYLNGNVMVNITVKEKQRSPVQAACTGGLWSFLDLSGTAFDTTNIDKIDITLASQSGNATDGPRSGLAISTPNYIALDNFVYNSLTAVTPTVTVPGGTTTLTATTSGTAGTSVSFNITGANLTGFPGNLTVTAPTNVQVSANNSTWSSTASIPYSTATLASTPVYVRLAGTGTVGTISGNVSITGGGLSTAVTQAVSGTLNAPPSPTITSATYDAATGVLSVTGTNIANTDTITPSKLTIAGANNASYTLTTGTATAGSNSFSVTLNAADQLRVNALLNKNGTASVEVTTYNLAAATNWDSTASAAADLTGNGITASNVAAPTITSATYDVSTHVLTVTGTRLVANGSSSGITVSKLAITGEGGAGTKYTLTTGDVDPSSVTTFAVTLNAADQAAVQKLFTRNGTTSTGGTTYNLAASDDWNTVITGGDISDSTNAITASNVAVPTFTSATFDGNTGLLVVSCSNLLPLAGSANDIVANKFCFVGDGNGQYCLNDTLNVEITSATSFTITLSTLDLAVINSLATKNGTSAADNTVYNLSAAQGWDAGAANGINDTVNTAAVTVTIAAPPATVTVPGGTTTLTATTSGTAGTSVSFNITGANLTGFPGNLTVTAPTNVQVSANNSTWGGTASIPYNSATLASTPVYVRLAGTGTVGTISGNVSINGGGLSAARTQAVSGTLNAAPPTITNVTSSTTDGTYKATAPVSIQVTFNASVTVTGTPTLALNTGGGGAATYASGSPGTTLTFNYTVGANQNSADLDYTGTGALTLAGGTINATTGGTPATLTLPAPAAVGSLGFNKAIVIDTTAPTILSINRQTPSAQITGSATVSFRVTYSENVVNVTTNSFAVIQANGSNIVGTVTGVSGTGNTRDVTVSITSGTGDFRLRGVN